MLSKIDIQQRLSKNRNARIVEDAIMKEVSSIFAEIDSTREEIFETIANPFEETQNDFNLDLLEAKNIYHIEDIKKLCVDYRLRFLDAHFFKGEIPEEAVSKIRQLEREHETKLHGFKVVAPAKLLKLENADDPLLLAPIGNDYYYLIHKWGNDLHPLRKLLMWPYKCFENLVFAVFLLSIIATALTPMQAFTKDEVTNQEYLLMFLFMFKAIGGIVLFYGFAKGKNFNNAIWNSKYYNA